jgi:hypothetical protein
MICLLNLPPGLLTIAFAGQCLLDSEFLAWLQIKGVLFDFADDVLLDNLPLEAAECILNRLAFLEPYLSQMAPPPTLRPIPSGVFAACPDFSDGIS